MDKKISQFDEVIGLLPNAYVPIVQGTPIDDYKITPNLLVSETQVVKDIIVEVSGNTQSIILLNSEVEDINIQIDNISQDVLDVYTKTETDNLLDGKSDSNHLHTGVYQPIMGSDDNYVTDDQVTSINTIGNKVDKVSGKELYSDNQADVRATLRFTDAEKTKLAGVESNKFIGQFTSEAALFLIVGTQGQYAYVDLGVGQDVAAYAWDTNDTKWVLQKGITTAETPATIKLKYESNADTNAFTDALETKLNSVASGAQVNVIETIQKNGVTLSPTSKTVNITVPTQASDISAEPANANIQSHISSTSNPHSTTASQVGAYSSGQTDTLLLNKVDKEVGKGLSEINLTHEMAEIYGNTVSTGWGYPIAITQVDSTHISVNSAEGFIIYNTGVNSETPILNEVNYLGDTNVLVSNIATSDITYFLVNVSGVLYQQTTYPTPEERRDNLFIGRVSHPNRTSILAIINTPDNETSPMSQLRDMFDGMKLMNNGISVYADGANLGFNISGGKLTGLGINASVNVKNPNQVTISGKIPASFYYRTQTGGSTGLVSVLTPGFYDVGGTITAISTGGDAQANRSTNIRVYQFSNGNVVAQYGQTVYSSLSLAIAGIPTEQFVQFSNVKENAILIGIISVRRAATVLNNTSFAIFTPASMFGEVSNSTNGTSITDLQGIYGNSSTPEIITDDTRLGLTLKDGTSSPTNNQFEIQNFSGVLKSSINGNGSYESIADYGSNEAPLVYDASNWTLTSGWVFDGNSLDKNAAGTTTSTALLGVAPIAQQVYKMTFTVANSIGTGTFVGNVTPSFAGTAFSAITAVGTYTYYIHAVSTAKLVFTPSTTNARFNISNISIVKRTDLTADVKVGGDVFFNGNRILNSNNNTPIMYWYPNGATYVVGAFSANSTISSSSTITGRQIATTTGTAATTTGAVTMTLSSNGNYYLSAALTGTITVTTSSPATGAKSHLFFTQGATAQSVIFSQTGVTWRQTSTTNSGTNTITLQNISTVNAFYKVMLDWASTTVCYITVM